jgi:hypothetical protein
MRAAPLLLGLAALALGLGETDQIVVGRFDQGLGKNGLPAAWERYDFDAKKKQTVYSLVADGERTLLRAASAGGASGILRRLDVDPRAYRRLAWRWKVDRALAKADEARKSGDDSPARVFVTFAYDPKAAGFFESLKFSTYRTLHGEYPPLCALVYQWCSKMARNDSCRNPYADRAVMIAVQSGGENVGRWISEERDVLADFRRVFGREPTRISGIALMTDTDYTNECATAWFDEIVLRRADR